MRDLKIFDQYGKLLQSAHDFFRNVMIEQMEMEKTLLFDQPAQLEVYRCFIGSSEKTVNDK
jgi:hypothetical protein